MPLIYISADGNWGAAEDLKIIDVTDEEIDELNDMSDGEVQEFAGKKIRGRIAEWDEHSGWVDQLDELIKELEK